MIFDLGIWPLTAWTYKGYLPYCISINKAWFQLDFNFSNEATCTFSVYLNCNLTSDELWPWCDLWPHQQMRVPMLHNLTLVEIHYSMWKVEPNVNLFSQQQTTTVDKAKQTTTVDKVIHMFLSCKGRRRKEKTKQNKTKQKKKTTQNKNKTKQKTQFHRRTVLPNKVDWSGH